MNFSIVVLDGHTLNPGDLNWDQLKEFGKLKVYPRSSPEEGIKRGKEADIIVVNKFVLSKDVLDKLPNLKYIVVSATGYNNIDLKATKKSGIPVSNVTGYSTSSVAQHVFAVLLSFLHKPHVYHSELREGKWSKSLDFSYWNEAFTELKDKKMGIYGYGEIGKQVARIAIAFDMKVLVHTRNPAKNLENIRFVALEELFSESDVLTLHAPQAASNIEFVSTNLLNLMKADSILINSARGSLINEADLYDALKGNKLRAALLDVLHVEPALENHPFFSLENCYLTPHLAWASRESRQRLMDGVVQNIRAFTSGNIENIVA